MEKKQHVCDETVKYWSRSLSLSVLFHFKTLSSVSLRQLIRVDCRRPTEVSDVVSVMMFDLLLLIVFSQSVLRRGKLDQDDDEPLMQAAHDEQVLDGTHECPSSTAAADAGAPNRSSCWLPLLAADLSKSTALPTTPEGAMHRCLSKYSIELAGSA